MKSSKVDIDRLTGDSIEEMVIALRVAKEKMRDLYRDKELLQQDQYDVERRIHELENMITAKLEEKFGLIMAGRHLDLTRFNSSGAKAQEGEEGTFIPPKDSDEN